ncbi:MAG: recombinase family protein [Bacteroidales bacterium]|nr:recombinase family protein [Bacteroidales bacterium]
MLVGYARTSTTHQNAGLDEQIERLQKEGCEKIFFEQVSSVYQRDELQKAIDFVRSGDVFIVTKIDRLARTVSNLLEITKTLENKNVQLKILDFGLDTHTATGKMMLQVIGAVAEFEREMMLERQRFGIEKAKQEGKFKGRMLSEGKLKKLEREINSYNPNSQDSLSIKEIASFCEVSVPTVYKKIRELAPEKLQKKTKKDVIIEKIFGGNSHKYEEFQMYQKMKRLQAIKEENK